MGWNLSIVEYTVVYPTGVMKHGGGLIVHLIDMFVVEQPMFWGDSRYPVCYALTYICFKCWYHRSGGTDASGNPYLYAALNWTQNFAASAKLAAAVIGIAVPFACLVLWILTGHRNGIVKRCFADQFLSSAY